MRYWWRCRGKPLLRHTLDIQRIDLADGERRWKAPLVAAGVAEQSGLQSQRANVQSIGLERVFIVRQGRIEVAFG